MAKVKLANLTDQATALSRGGFIINDGKFGPYASKWPKKRGKAKTPYDRFRQKEFGIAATMASNPMDLDYICAESSVKGTHLVPRDWLLMCTMGLAYVITLEDGTEYVPYRHVTNNPQYVFEQLTSDPGSIIYRGQDYWYGLNPGNAGQVLTMRDGLPSWQFVSGGGSNYAKRTSLRRTTNQAAQSAATRKVIWESALIDENLIWDPANPTRIYLPSTAAYIKLTYQILCQTLSGTEQWTGIALDAAGSAAYAGCLRNAHVNLATATTIGQFSATSVWFPKPATSYLELTFFTSSASSRQFLAGCQIDIEVL